MPTWDPVGYLKFAHRLRPALDLLAQFPHESPCTVNDLGCGPAPSPASWRSVGLAGAQGERDHFGGKRRPALG